MRHGLATRGCAALLIGAAVLVGCGGSASSDDPVRVLSTNLLSTGPLLIVEHEGLFEKHGVTVEYERAQATGNVLPLLESGEVDVWIGAPSPALYALADAEPGVRIVADKGRANEDCAFFSFVGRTEELGDDGWDADELRGRRIGFPTAAMTAAFYADRVLDRVGLTRDDVEVVELAFPVAAEAVRKGQVDLGVVIEPLLTAAVADGELAVYAPTQEIVPNLQSAVVAFGPRLVEEDRELGERVMAAYLDGVKQYNEGATERNVEIMTEATEVDSGLLEEACWPAVADDARVDLPSMLETQEWAVAEGLQDEVIPAERFWDGGFIDAALAE